MKYILPLILIANSAHAQRITDDVEPFEVESFDSAILFIGAFIVFGIIYSFMVAFQDQPQKKA